MVGGWGADGTNLPPCDHTKKDQIKTFDNQSGRFLLTVINSITEKINPKKGNENVLRLTK